MNSDKLNHISFHEDEELPIGHMQRFEKKLDYELHKKKFQLNINNLAVAATIAILFAAGVLLLQNFKTKQSSKLLLATYSPDLAETEKYYRNTLNNRIKTIQERENIDMEINTEIKEFQESLKNLKGDMKINPGDERLVNAYLGLYQTQIELLDNIIEQYN
jgi:hypothetical protein